MNQDGTTTDAAEAPTQELPVFEGRATRTGFALLRNNQPSLFEVLVGNAIDRIEEVGGDVINLFYGTERGSHFGALHYTVPAEIFDDLREELRVEKNDSSVAVAGRKTDEELEAEQEEMRGRASTGSRTIGAG